MAISRWRLRAELSKETIHRVSSYSTSNDPRSWRFSNTRILISSARLARPPPFPPKKTFARKRPNQPAHQLSSWSLVVSIARIDNRASLYGKAIDT